MMNSQKLGGTVDVNLPPKKQGYPRKGRVGFAAPPMKSFKRSKLVAQSHRARQRGVEVRASVHRAERWRCTFPGCEAAKSKERKDLPDLPCRHNALPAAVVPRQQAHVLSTAHGG